MKLPYDGMSLFSKMGKEVSLLCSHLALRWQVLYCTVLYIFSSEMASLTNFMETLKALAATFPKVRSL